MALGTLFCVKSQESLAHALGNPVEAIKAFQRRSTDSLLISKYTTSPGPYTLEALLINAQNEFLRRREAHLSVWILGGIAIRLAMRMGYREYLRCFASNLSRRLCISGVSPCRVVGVLLTFDAGQPRPRPLALSADITLRGRNASSDLVHHGAN